MGSEVTGIAAGDRLFCQGANRSTQRYDPHLTVPVPAGLDPVTAVLALLMGVSMTTLIDHRRPARRPGRRHRTGAGRLPGGAPVPPCQLRGDRRRPGCAAAPVGGCVRHRARVRAAAARRPARRRTGRPGGRLLRQRGGRGGCLQGAGDGGRGGAGRDAVGAQDRGLRPGDPQCGVLPDGDVAQCWEYEIPLRRLPFTNRGHDRDYGNARHTVLSVTARRSPGSAPAGSRWTAWCARSRRGTPPPSTVACSAGSTKSCSWSGTGPRGKRGSPTRSGG